LLILSPTVRRNCSYRHWATKASKTMLTNQHVEEPTQYTSTV